MFLFCTLPHTECAHSHKTLYSVLATGKKSNIYSARSYATSLKDLKTQFSSPLSTVFIRKFGVLNSLSDKHSRQQHRPTREETHYRARKDKSSEPTSFYKSININYHISSHKVCDFRKITLPSSIFLSVVSIPPCLLWLIRSFISLDVRSIVLSTSGLLIGGKIGFPTFE